MISFAKHISPTFFSVLMTLVSPTNCWADDPVPPNSVFEINQQMVVSGEVVLFNGWQPNIRMLIEDNKIIGIGKTESDFEVSVPRELRGYLGSEFEINATVVLKYIGSVTIGYYDRPLPCFDIIKVEKLKVRKFNSGEWKILR